MSGGEDTVSPNDFEPWSLEDRDRLLTLAADSLDELAVHFPLRTRNAVMKKAKLLGRRFKRISRKGDRKHWSQDEITTLLSNRHLTKYQLADLLPGRTPLSVTFQAKKYHITIACLKRNGHMLEPKVIQLWTPSDDRALYWMAGNISQREAAIKLGRSEEAVKQRAHQLQLQWRDQRLSMRRLAKYLSVSPCTIGKHRDKLCLSFRKNSNAARPPSETDIQAIAASILAAGTAPYASGSRLMAVARGEWDATEL